MENNLPWKLQPTRDSCGKILHVLKTTMAAVYRTLTSHKPTQFLPEDLAIRDT